MNASPSDISDQLAAAAPSPFSLDDEAAYASWRARKLDLRRALDPARCFALAADGCLPPADLAAAARQIDAFGFILFKSGDLLDKGGFLALNHQLGLASLDANPGADADRVTQLSAVADDDPRAQYIPYTNRALNWHTDGYYNARERAIQAFSLYCVQPASRGGGNFLFDHEYLYLRIRDEDPELMEALMCPDLMLIPANVQGNHILRGEETGPVFAVDDASGALQMRFTSRPRNIVWKDDKASTRALDRLREILMTGDGVVELRLRRAQGIVCRNLLHGREAFADEVGQPPRLVYRARFHDPLRPLDDIVQGAG